MDRRTMLAGILACAGEGLAAAAAPQRPLFAGTALANNFMALLFERASLTLSAIPVDAHGATSLGKLRGRTTIVSLWAE